MAEMVMAGDYAAQRGKFPRKGVVAADVLGHAVDKLDNAGRLGIFGGQPHVAGKNNRAV